MVMPGRKYEAENAYRYGFNAKENDNEVKGEGNQQDYGMRIYDPRLGRFLSVDPLTRSFPWNSPYSFAEGDVIRSIDLDGLEKFITNYREIKRTNVYEFNISTLESNGERVDNMLHTKDNIFVAHHNVFIVQNNVMVGGTVEHYNQKDLLDASEQKILDEGDQETKEVGKTSINGQIIPKVYNKVSEGTKDELTSQTLNKPGDKAIKYLGFKTFKTFNADKRYTGGFSDIVTNTEYMVNI